jgi:hypothetical protein
MQGSFWRAERISASQSFPILEADLCERRRNLKYFAFPAEIYLLFDCNTRLNMTFFCKYTSCSATNNIKIDELFRVELQSKNACKHLYQHIAFKMEALLWFHDLYLFLFLLKQPSHLTTVLLTIRTYCVRE